jgi:hypothetical protein
MSANMPWSRRAILAAIGVGAAAARAKADAGDAPTYHPQAQQQLTKAAAHYQEQPHGDQLCVGCPYFIQPGSCVMVEGAISPSGWCPMFTTFSPLDRGAHS